MVRELLGSDRLWDQLDTQVTLMCNEAAALRSTGTSEAIDRAEVEAEKASRAFEASLRSAFVVPIDREDLHGLASAIDGLAAWITRSRRALLTLDVEPISGMNGLGELVVTSSREIAAGIGHLRRTEYDDVILISRELRRLHLDGELAHDEAVSKLFAPTDGRDAQTLVRAKAPLDDFASTVRQCGAVGKLLAYLAVKNG
jgi:uncharacterized protein Yka (UPF0111/DUF47 family)